MTDLIFTIPAVPYLPPRIFSEDPNITSVGAVPDRFVGSTSRRSVVRDTTEDNVLEVAKDYLLNAAPYLASAGLAVGAAFLFRKNLGGLARILRRIGTRLVQPEMLRWVGVTATATAGLLFTSQIRRLFSASDWDPDRPRPFSFIFLPKRNEATAFSMIGKPRSDERHQSAGDEISAKGRVARALGIGRGRELTGGEFKKGLNQPARTESERTPTSRSHVDEARIGSIADHGVSQSHMKVTNEGEPFEFRQQPDPKSPTLVALREQEVVRQLVGIEGDRSEILPNGIDPVLAEIETQSPLSRPQHPTAPVRLELADQNFEIASPPPTVSSSPAIQTDFTQDPSLLQDPVFTESPLLEAVASASEYGDLTRQIDRGEEVDQRSPKIIQRPEKQTGPAKGGRLARKGSSSSGRRFVEEPHEIALGPQTVVAPFLPVPLDNLMSTVSPRPAARESWKIGEEHRFLLSMQPDDSIEGDEIAWVGDAEDPFNDDQSPDQDGDSEDQEETPFEEDLPA